MARFPERLDVTRVGLWKVVEDRAQRLPEHDILEKSLETWVEKDPALVLEGVRWAQRQRTLPDRSRLDLLGLTREGQLVVAELKSGPVNMATLQQALGYAMQVGTMEADELLSGVGPELREEVSAALEASPRPITLLLVGTSRGSDLERGLAFLQTHAPTIPVRVVTFGLFRVDDGTVLLARDVVEHEAAAATDATPTDRVIRIAEDQGVANELRFAIELAGRLGLRTKAWRNSLTVNSPANWRKTMLYVGLRAQSCEVGYSAEAYQEAFGVSAEELDRDLGPNWKVLPKAEVRAWLQRAEDLTRNAQARLEGAA